MEITWENSESLMLMEIVREYQWRKARGYEGGLYSEGNYDSSTGRFGCYLWDAFESHYFDLVFRLQPLQRPWQDTEGETRPGNMLWELLILMTMLLRRVTSKSRSAAEDADLREFLGADIDLLDSSLVLTMNRAGDLITLISVPNGWSGQWDIDYQFEKEALSRLSNRSRKSPQPLLTLGLPLTSDDLALGFSPGDSGDTYSILRGDCYFPSLARVLSPVRKTSNYRRFENELRTSGGVEARCGSWVPALHSETEAINLCHVFGLADVWLDYDDSTQKIKVVILPEQIQNGSGI